MRTAVAALSFVLAACAACGGNGDEGGSASESANDPQAQERAEGFVLQLADFPNGWRGSAPEEQDEDSAETFRTCAGIDFSGLTRIGKADSLDFATGQSTEASSQATVFASDEEAQQGMTEFAAGMNSSEAEDCFQDLIAQNLKSESGVKVGEVDIGQFNLTPPDVEEAAAWQIAVPIEITSGAGEGLSPSAYLEFVALREGDEIATLQTSDVLTQFDSALRDQLVAAVAGRMTGGSG